MSLCPECHEVFEERNPEGFLYDPVIPEHNKVEGVFRDEGAKSRVRVIHDRMEGDYRVLNLVVIERIRPSPIHGPMPSGPFKVYALPGKEHLVGWSIQLDGEKR